MSNLTKQSWIDEFERRTGEKFEELCRSQSRAKTLYVGIANNDNPIYLPMTTPDDLYSRAHLEAAVAAVGEVGRG